MSTRLEWQGSSSITKEELKEDDTISMATKISRMSFEPIRHSVDQSMGLDRKSLCHTPNPGV